MKPTSSPDAPPPEPADMHAVADEVRARVLGELTRLEALHDMRVLFACESGSRGWGFASADSDYDVRFIYVHGPQWYLRVARQRDVIECPISDALDVSGWELRKALSLARGGNATLGEWLDSPVVYRAHQAFAAELRGTLDTVFLPDRAYLHYVHMAQNNCRGYLQGERVRHKKYFYVLRPVLAAEWIVRGWRRPPMRFESLLQALVPRGPVRHAVDALLIVKRSARESETGPRIDVLNAYIDSALDRLAQAAPQRPEAPDFSPLDSLLYRTVMEAKQ